MEMIFLCLAALPLQLSGFTPTLAQQTSDLAFSANGLFLGGYTKREDAEGATTSRTGLYMQQAELQVTALVDSALQARFTFSLPSRRGDKGGWFTQEVTVSEGFIAIGLHHHLLVKAGRFYAEFGQHNLLHMHQFPFLDPPLVLERLFGEAGLNEVGMGLRWSLPTPWQAEVSAQVLNGDNPLWVNPTDEDLLYLGHLKNLWNLGQSAALEVGGSWAGGRNLVEKFTSATGTDFALKWRRAPHRALTWQTEYLSAREDLRVEHRKRGGMYSFLQYQFARRWWVQGRYDRFGLPAEKKEERESRFSGLLAFVQSEFSSLRFQYSRWRVEAAGRGFNQYHLQLNFSVGSHPASRTGPGIHARSGDAGGEKSR